MYISICDYDPQNKHSAVPVPKINSEILKRCLFSCFLTEIAVVGLDWLRSTLPMMITEYGADAYDNSNQREWQNDEQHLGDRWRGPGLTSL